MGLAFLEHFGKTGGALLPSVKSRSPRKNGSPRVSRLPGLDQELSRCRCRNRRAPARARHARGCVGAIASTMGKRVRQREAEASTTCTSWEAETIPTLDRSASSWSAVGLAGLGLRVDFTRHLAAVGEAQALFLFPPPEVRFADVLLGRVGQPSLLASAGVIASF